MVDVFKDFLQYIFCLTGRHRFHILKKISRQAALVGCDYCKKKYALKLDGDNIGSTIPWVEAQFFYTDKRIKRSLNE